MYSTAKDRVNVYALYMNKLKKAEDSLQISGFVCLLSTICMWQIRGANIWSFVIYSVGVILLYFASLSAIRFESMNLRFRKNTIFLIFLEMVSLIYIMRNSSEITGAIGNQKKYILILELFVLVLVQQFQLFFTLHKRNVTHKHIPEISILIFLTIVFAFVLNIECFNLWPRWDSYAYFHDFEKKSAHNIFLSGDKGLNICGHISSAYALWTLLFRIIPGIGNLNTMYFSNMALIAINFVLLYVIFKKILPTASWIQNIIYASITVCSPWILGCVASLSPDYFITTGMLLLLYAVVSDNKLLCLFGVFVVCYTKETGVPMAAMIIGTQLLFALVNGIKNKKIKEINWLYFFLCMIIGIMWLCQYHVDHWSWNDSQQPNYMLDGPKLHRLAFSPLHIADCLTEIICGNFGWIFSSLILIALCILFIRLIQKKEKISLLFSKKIYWFILSGFIGYAVIICGYVTFHLYRYYNVAHVMLCILGICSFDYITRTLSIKCLLNYMVSGLLLGILLTQSYTTIDPVSKLIHPSFSTGNSTLTSLSQHYTLEDGPYFDERAFYNRQCMYFDKALDKVYQKIYKENKFDSTKILCSNEYIGIKGYLGSLFEIWGFGYHYLEPLMFEYWNNENNYRYLTFDEPENDISPAYIFADTDMNEYLNKYAHIYYLKMPWGDTVLNELKQKYPTIDNFFTINYRGWTLEVYKIK